MAETCACGATVVEAYRGIVLTCCRVDHPDWVLASIVRVEYGWRWDDPHSDDPVIPYESSIRNTWPNNDPAQGGKGPWSTTRINRKPVHVVKRTVVWGPWIEAREPEPPFDQVVTS
jgi:hypothetical protein